MEMMLIGTSTVLLVALIVYYVKTAFNEIDRLDKEND
jgi:hypothetical protein